MTDRDPVEAVIEALERQMTKTVLRPRPHTELARGLLHGATMQTDEVASANEGLRPDSLIKARYASTVLRVAQTTDANTAARLVHGLACDLPHSNEFPQIIEIHLRAIASFVQLTSSLNASTHSERQSAWKAALDAVANWLRAVEAK